MGHYCHDLDFVVAFFVVSLCFVCLQRCCGEVGHGFLIGSLTHLQCFWFNQLQPQNPALQLACCQIILSIRRGMWALSNSRFSWASLASSVFEKKKSHFVPSSCLLYEKTFSGTGTYRTATHPPEPLLPPESSSLHQQSHSRSLNPPSSLHLPLSDTIKTL